MDIFFIISGFLITSKIIESIETDRFTLKEFYKRRVLRLFPGLMLVFVCFTLVAWTYFYPADFENYLKHLFASTLFASNFTHYFEVNYFAKAAEFKPLLHFWSLAVEEQFYLLWPLLLSLFLKKKHLLRSVLVVMLISFAINVLRVNVDSQEIYYLFHGRFWELLMGGYMALLLKNTELKIPALGKNFLSWAGLFLLFLSFFIISKHFYPGWWALLPTTGTALIILGGSKAWFNRVILSSSPAVYLGRISYPMYLWHWPLLSFGIICGLHEPKHIWMFLGLCVVLAVVTYEFFEKPLKKIQNKNRLALSLIGVNLIISVIAGLAFFKKFPPLNSGREISNIMLASKDWYPYPQGLKLVNPQDKIHYFEFGQGKEVILLAGDSHLQMYIPYFKQHADLGRFKFYVVSEGGCAFIPDVKSEVQPEKDMCPDLVNLAKEIGNRKEVTRIAIVTGWTNYLTQNTRFYFQHPGERLVPGSEPYQKSLSALEAWIKDFTSQGKKVFLFGTIAMGEEFVPELMIQRNLPDPVGQIHIRPFDLYAFNRGHRQAFHDVRVLAENAGANFIDPIPTFCPDGECEVMTKDRGPVYWNHAHIRPYYIMEKANFLKNVMFD